MTGSDIVAILFWIIFLAACLVSLAARKDD